MSPRTTKAKLVKAQMSEAEALWYSGKWIDRVPQWVSILVVGNAFMLLWQLIYSLHFISPILLPGPWETTQELWYTTKEIFVGPPGGGVPHLRTGLWITTKETFLGFIAAAASGFFLGDRVVVMSARPGRIAEIVDVDLPRPRSLDMMTTPVFSALVHHVRGLLDMGEAKGGEA